MTIIKRIRIKQIKKNYDEAEITRITIAKTIKGLEGKREERYEAIRVMFSHYTQRQRP